MSSHAVTCPWCRHGFWFNCPVGHIMTATEVLERQRNLDELCKDAAVRKLFEIAAERVWPS